MVITEEYIEYLEFYYLTYFPEELKNILLEELGEEPPTPYSYSEQDI